MGELVLAFEWVLFPLPLQNQWSWFRDLLTGLKWRMKRERRVRRTLLNSALLAFITEEDLDFLLVFVWELWEGVRDTGCLGECVHFGEIRRSDGEVRFVQFGWWTLDWVAILTDQRSSRSLTPHIFAVAQCLISSRCGRLHHQVFNFIFRVLHHVQRYITLYIIEWGRIDGSLLHSLEVRQRPNSPSYLLCIPQVLSRKSSFHPPLLNCSFSRRILKNTLVVSTGKFLCFRGLSWKCSLLNRLWTTY